MWNKIAYYHNKLADGDFVWFPFMILRPEPTQKIGLGRHILMAICFGIYFSLFNELRNYLFEGSIRKLDDFLFITAQFIGFFFVWV
jgi:hypothetical protein